MVLYREAHLSEWMQSTFITPHQYLILQSSVHPLRSLLRLCIRPAALLKGSPIIGQCSTARRPGSTYLQAIHFCLGLPYLGKTPDRDSDASCTGVWEKRGKGEWC